MIRELFLEDMSLWGCVWQSASFAAIGLIGSFLLRRRPARASQVLFLAMIAAVVVPTASVLVRHFDLGVFVARPVALVPQAPRASTVIYQEASVAAPPIYVENEVHTEIAELPVIEVGSARAQIPWRLIVLYGWMAASLILLGRLLVAVVSGIYLLRRAQPTGCEQIKQAAESAGSKLGIVKGLRVRSSRDVHSPVIWCWSSPPVLLVPNDLDHKVDWVGVICHELAHWMRKDHLTGLIAELAVCILPWNPLLWWSKKRMVRFSEQACDDWVVAGGQPREDYAQSLLDFKPQKQVAFVPAVVSCKKTLAGRVRRILKDSCSNPRTGAAWALTVIAIAICLAAGIAFAQTRPTRPAATIKTKVSQSAVIEQPAFATMTIRGRILDSNNEPAYGTRIVALPVTSWGYRTEPQSRNKEGYFELPWSPTWIDKGRPIRLIATSGTYRDGSHEYETAIVEVLDPTKPVTVRLEPSALRLEGDVVDPSGQPLEQYSATLSLLTEFKCRAPIAAMNAWGPGKLTFSAIPQGRTYDLAIHAKGFQTRRLTVDATDRSKETIDIGKIVVQRYDPTGPVIPEEGPEPDLAKEFHEIYQLEEQEVLKFVEVPFVLGRQEYLHAGGGIDSFPFGRQHGSMQIGFRWDDKLKIHSGHGTVSPNLKSALRLMLDIPYYDFNIPQGLNLRLPHGGWIVRHESPIGEQLRALEEILHAQLNRSIRFEKRTVERDVITAKGRYEFKPHPSGEEPNSVHITWDGTLNGGGGARRSPAKLFRFIEDQIKVRIVDETEPMEDTFVPYQIVDETEPMEDTFVPYQPMEDTFVPYQDGQLDCPC